MSLLEEGGSLVECQSNGSVKSIDCNESSELKTLTKPVINADDSVCTLTSNRIQDETTPQKYRDDILSQDDSEPDLSQEIDQSVENVNDTVTPPAFGNGQVVSWSKVNAPGKDSETSTQEDQAVSDETTNVLKRTSSVHNLSSILEAKRTRFS